MGGKAGRDGLHDAAHDGKRNGCEEEEGTGSRNHVRYPPATMFMERRVFQSRESNGGYELMQGRGFAVDIYHHGILDGYTGKIVRIPWREKT